ncbi:MAG: hypothetical protein SGI96_21255 [Bacteroidota bacterium]|nr:hypothetical protein [Bacteroidota bacterium]
MIEKFEEFIFDLTWDLKFKIRFSHCEQEKEYSMKMLGFIEQLLQKHGLEELL